MSQQKKANQELTFEQQVKLALVALAEYLQCKPLSDAQIRLYAADLIDLGPEGLAQAIVLLKADPEVWAGRFPLPAKLKQYALGDVDMIAQDGAMKIMACKSVREMYERLPTELLSIAKAYGLNSITERNSSQASTIYAQLRDLVKSSVTLHRREKTLGYQKTGSIDGRGSQLSIEDAIANGKLRELAGRLGRDSPLQGSDRGAEEGCEDYPQGAREGE